MTVTHPSVMALKPVTEGRHPVRVTAPKVTTARPGTTAPPREQESVDQPSVVDPIAAADERAEIDRRTRLTIHLASVAIRTIAIVGMLAVAYLAFSQNWIGAATDSLVGWYGGTVAPYLEIDPVPPELPVGNGALFVEAPTPSFVLPD